MIACTEAVRQLWSYLDGLSDTGERAAIEEHLAYCVTCCGEFEFAKELRRMLGSAAREDVPDDVLRRLNTTLEELE